MEQRKARLAVTCCPSDNQGATLQTHELVFGEGACLQCVSENTDVCSSEPSEAALAAGRLCA